MNAHRSSMQRTVATTLAPRLVAMNSGAVRETPIYQQIAPWLMFWPLLTMIARQNVYFDGPARTAEAIQNGASAAGGASSSHMFQYVYLAILLGFVVSGYRQVLSVLKKNPLICAILGFALCSTLWSSAPNLTIQMCLKVSLCSLFACYLSARYTTERLMRLMVFMGVPAALLSILFAVALPSYGIFQGYSGGAWQGICQHKNALGVSMAFLLSPIFFTTAYTRVAKYAYGALLLFLIAMSQSRGAWACALGMLLFVGWLRVVRQVRNREYALVVITTASIIILVVTMGVYFWPMLANSMGKDATMTGRTGIYREAWSSIMKRPLAGYGFGGFWYVGSNEADRIRLALSWPNIGYAENGILDMALQIGFLGVGLIVWMISAAIIKGVHLLRSPNYSPRVGWFLTILFYVVLTNIDAGWFMTAQALDWVLILIACIGLNEEIRGSSGPKISIQEARR
jgi:exopolysaccharide production protein ExoQ